MSFRLPQPPAGWPPPADGETAQGSSATTGSLAEFVSSSELAPVEGADGSSGYERTVRENIQNIRKNLQGVEDNLRSLHRNLVSRRIVESLHEKLKAAFGIVVETENLFREWTVHLAGEPQEKARKKFLFEKLSANFKAEVERVQEISIRTQQVAARVSDVPPSSGYSPSASGTHDDSQPDGRWRRNGESPGGASGPTSGPAHNNYDADESHQVGSFLPRGSLDDYAQPQHQQQQELSPRDVTELQEVTEQDCLVEVSRLAAYVGD
eukprot:GHVT01085710.1.p1 GENE.GHVT01085710.1~~GHVT01085710.1.p1  ORF type:complete len:266 (+),score=51.83 GHVT01085710.1:631-1428(+)